MSELLQFHQFVAEQLAQGTIALSPEDCLDIWRANHPAPEELAEGLAGVKEGLAQARRNEGMPLAEFDRKFRAEKGISGNSI